MCVYDKVINSEYEAENRLNTRKLTVSLYSPLDNDREAIYGQINEVSRYLESILNEPFDGGIIRWVTNINNDYRGVTTENAIVYEIVGVLTDEVKLY